MRTAAVWPLTGYPTPTWCGVPLRRDGGVFGDTLRRPSMYEHGTSREDVEERIRARFQSVRSVEVWR
jgi:hypothetical protein